MNPHEAHELLGLAPGASDKEIKAAFKKLAKKHHPDVGGDEQKFKEINEAYSILTGKSQPQPEPQMGPGFGFDINEFFNQTFDTMFRGAGASRTINRVHVDPELLIKGGAFEYTFQYFERVGERLRQANKTVHIRVEPDTPVLAQIVVPGTEPNHIFLQLVPGSTQKYGVTDTVHLTETKQIDAFAAMLGGDLDVTAPNGKQIKINYPPGTQHGETHRMRGLGLRTPDGRHGDYNVCFLITIPALQGTEDEIKKRAADLLAERIK